MASDTRFSVSLVSKGSAVSNGAVNCRHSSLRSSLRGSSGYVLGFSGLFVGKFEEDSPSVIPLNQVVRTPRVLFGIYMFFCLPWANFMFASRVCSYLAVCLFVLRLTLCLTHAAARKRSFFLPAYHPSVEVSSKNKDRKATAPVQGFPARVRASPCALHHLPFPNNPPPNSQPPRFASMPPPPPPPHFLSRLLPALCILVCLLLCAHCNLFEHPCAKSLAPPPPHPRWAPDGSAFVTASHDKVVTLYTLRGGGDGTGQGGVGGTGFEQVRVMGGGGERHKTVL